jgi:hypothetical protein
MLSRMQKLREQGKKVAVVGQVNGELLFMLNDAVVPAENYDLIIDNPRYTNTLLGPPSPPIDTVDYMIGLSASSLLPDGGTLQIGIGSLGDAIAHGSILRQEQNERYRAVLSELGMLENFGDVALQRLVNAKKIGSTVTPQTLDILLDEGVIAPQLSRRDFDFLQKFGIFRETVSLEGEVLRTADGTGIAGRRCQVIRRSAKLPLSGWCNQGELRQQAASGEAGLDRCELTVGGQFKPCYRNSSNLF